MTTPDYTSEIPYGYCHCGCGQKTTIATRTARQFNSIKGEPRKFIVHHGTGKSHTKSLDAFWSKVAITADDNQCWLWQGSVNRHGYGAHRVDRKRLSCHRIAWMYPNYIIPEGMFVCHSCDNPSCCNPKHLWIGTHQDNMNDMKKKKRQSFVRAQGENHGLHTLTNEQVANIRWSFEQGKVSIGELSEEYLCSKEHIRKIVKNETRKNG